MIRRADTRGARLAAIGMAVALSYAVLLGGTAIGEIQPWLRVVNALVAGTLIVLLTFRRPRRADRIDLAVVAALLLFLLAAVLSAFPRQSLDAALAAFTYVAAFLLGRDLLASASARRVILRTLMGLSALITLLTAARWIPLFTEWWSLTGWTVFPPLDLNLSSDPWGHRHDLALLVSMLYPSWWIGRRNPFRAAMAAVLGVLALCIVVIDGSRTLWLAIAAATAIGLLPLTIRVARAQPRRRLAGIGIGLAALAVVGLVAFGGPIIDRLGTLSTLGARSAMWGSLTELWFERPIAGVGPGSFPWALQLTDYFDTNTWAPRHPDSVLFQLLPEAGLLGVTAIAALVVGLLPPLLRAASSPARWAVLVFALAGIGASPADFAFLIVVLIAWTAYALPRTDEPDERPAPRWTGIGMRAASALIGVAYAATVLASFAYADARRDIDAGHFESAVARLDAAVAFDPGMALYIRQRGTLRLLQGEPRRAIDDLSRATDLNPSDDAGWRALALARLDSGDGAGAVEVLARAISVQRSDPVNLLLAVQMGRDPEAIAEIVHGWPTVVAASGWDGFLPPPITSADDVAMAIERWREGLPSPVPITNQALQLVALGNRADLDEEAIGSSLLSPELATMSLSVFRCEADASSLLEQASGADRRTAQYWALRVKHAAEQGQSDEASERLYELMTGDSLSTDDGERDLNPLWDRGPTGFSADAWGYRRPPISWPDYRIALPSPDAGNTRWLVGPDAASLACSPTE